MDLRPEAISARAGVSLSTFFRHFGDLAGLAGAIRERIEARVRPHLTGGSYEGPLRERVRELVRRLTTGFEIVAPFYRVTLRQSLWPSTARELPLEIAEATRTQVEAALGPELAGRPDRERVLCTLLSFDAWSHMRQVLGLSQERVTALLEDAVLALLASR